MSDKKVTVVAHFEAKPGKEAELKKLLLTLLVPTRMEAGCINYDLHVSQENPAQFLFYENWTSRELLNTHLASKHLQAVLPETSLLCIKSPEVTFWDKLA